MTCSTAAISVIGISAANMQSNPTSQPTRARRVEPGPPIASNVLERLAQLMIANDRLMDELVTSRARIVAARIYLDRPDCNTRFGSAHLDRCRVKHSVILAGLRSNRIEALHLLGEGGSVA